MRTDELKIQLEARQDFLFLQSELEKYLENNSFSSTPEQRKRVPLRGPTTRLTVNSAFFLIVSGGHS